MEGRRKRGQSFIHPLVRETSAARHLGGGSSVGLVVAGDGDAPLAAARLAAALDLGPAQSQQAVVGEAAADG